MILVGSFAMTATSVVLSVVTIATGNWKPATVGLGFAVAGLGLAAWSIARRRAGWAEPW